MAMRAQTRLAIIASVALLTASVSLAQEEMAPPSDAPGVEAPAAGASGSVQLSNEHLRLSVDPSGEFGLSTAAGRWLLYPSGGTSMVSIWVDGDVTAIGNGRTARILSGPQTVSERRCEVEFALGTGLNATQELSLVGEAVRFTVSVHNGGPQAVHARVRYELDTQVNDNDGSPLYSPGSGTRTHEWEAYRPAFREWRGYDRWPEPSLTGIGTIETIPDRIVFAHWPAAGDTTWDYSIDEGLSFFTPGQFDSPESDSCVLLYFDLGMIGPGETASASTCYGVGAPSGLAANERLADAIDSLAAAAEASLDAQVDLAARALAVTYLNLEPDDRSVFTLDLTHLASAASGAAQGGGVAGAAASALPSIPFEIGLGWYDNRQLAAIEDAVPLLFDDIPADADSEDDLFEHFRSVLASPSVIDTEALREGWRERASSLQTRLEQRLDEGYPIDDICNSLAVTEAGFAQAASLHREMTLKWVSAEAGTYGFTKIGTLQGWLKMARACQGAERANRTLLNPYLIGAGVVAGKIVVGLLSAGTVTAAEAVVAVGGGALAGSVVGLERKAADIQTDNLAAVVASHSLAAVYAEAFLHDRALYDTFGAVEASLSDAAPWVAPRFSISRVNIADVELSSDELTGLAQGSITVSQHGSAPVPVSVWAEVVVDGETVASSPEVTHETLPPGEDREVSFEVAAPDASWLGPARAYVARVWVGVATGLSVIASEDTTFRVGSRDKLERLSDEETITLVSEELREGERISRSINVVADRAYELELVYPGSDVDIHLYSVDGSHVGANYDTGALDEQIQGARHYEGSDGIALAGVAPGEYRVEIVGMDLPFPEQVTLLQRSRPVRDAELEIVPGEVAVAEVPEATEGPAAATLCIAEIGGDNGADNLEWSLSGLQFESGRSYSPGDTQPMVEGLPDSLAPGERASIRLVFPGEDLRFGDPLTGDLVITGFSPSLGGRCEAVAHIRAEGSRAGIAVVIPDLSRVAHNWPVLSMLGLALIALVWMVAIYVRGRKGIQHCPHCHAIAPPAASFCGRCGRPLGG